MPFLLRNARQQWQDHLAEVDKARSDMEKKVEDILNARSQVDNAINRLEAAAPQEPFSLLGDHVFRPGNGKRRQDACRQFRETKNVIIEYTACLRRVQSKLERMLSIARNCVRYLSLVQGNRLMMSNVHILREGLGVDLSFGGIKIGAWVVLGIGGVAFTTALSLALASSVESVTLVCPAIVAAVALVAILIGGIVAGELRKDAFEECLAKAKAAYEAVCRAQAQGRQAEQAIDDQFHTMRELLRDLGSNVGPTPEDVDREMHSLLWNTQALALILGRYRRDVANGRPYAADEAVQAMADDIPDLNLNNVERRQLLTIDAILGQAGDQAVEGVRAQIQLQGGVMTDRVHALVRLAVADVRAHRDEGSTEAGDSESSTETGDDEAWQELIGEAT